MRYPNAAKGINKIFLAEILEIVAAVLGIGVVVLLAANKIDIKMTGEAVAEALKAANVATLFTVLSIVIGVIVVAAFVLRILGIDNASKDEASFKRAQWAVTAGLVLDLVVSLIQKNNAQLAGWLKVLPTVCELAVTLYVLEGIAHLAVNLGKKQIADMCASCRTYLTCALVLSAAAQVFVAIGFAGQAVNTTSGVCAYLLEIVAYVFYLRVLNQARQMQ